ncbi:MAG TPA: PIN domain-containing protein, partial [Dehalococcoidia bacterium]|nr:PIN domain-containing protein [Dehalococcoidia bacterium]
EVTYFLASRLGPSAEAAFLRDLDLFEVEAPLGEEWPEIAALVEEYADFPLGAVDASVVTLARRLGTHVIVTLDHRHFRALRTESGDAYTLLP